MSLLAKREENGAMGESLTQSVLLSRFWVLKRSADVDGADFLVQHQYNSLEELRYRAHGIEILGIIQSKYFQQSNRVEVKTSYVLDKGLPRKEFFCFLHSHDTAGEPEHYFFSAEDIVKEFNLSGCGECYWFSLAAGRKYKNYKNKRQEFILDKIESGMYQAEGEARKKFMRSKLSAYARPTMHFDKQPNFEYKLEIVNRVRVVTAVDMKRATRRLLEPRRDLYENQGDYFWGDDETGCHFLAVSMLAHHLDGASPGDASVRKLIRFLLNLDEESTHVIKSKALQDYIEGPELAINRLQELEDKYPVENGGMDVAFFEVVSLLGTELKIKCRNGIESTLDINGAPFMKRTVDAARIFSRGIESSDESTRKMIAVRLFVQRNAEAAPVMKILNAFDIHIVD